MGLSRHGIRDLQLVSRKVNVHLVTGKMFHMPDDLRLKPVSAKKCLELGRLVSVRIHLCILTIEASDGCPFAAETLRVLWQQCLQFCSPGRWLVSAWLSNDEHLLKMFFRHGKKAFH